MTPRALAVSRLTATAIPLKYSVMRSPVPAPRMNPDRTCQSPNISCAPSNGISSGSSPVTAYSSGVPSTFCRRSASNVKRGVPGLIRISMV